MASTPSPARQSTGSGPSVSPFSRSQPPSRSRSVSIRAPPAASPRRSPPPARPGGERSGLSPPRRPRCSRCSRAAPDAAPPPRRAERPGGPRPWARRFAGVREAASVERPRSPAGPPRRGRPGTEPFPGAAPAPPAGAALGVSRRVGTSTHSPPRAGSPPLATPALSGRGTPRPGWGHGRGERMAAPESAPRRPRPLPRVPPHQLVAFRSPETAPQTRAGASRCRRSPRGHASPPTRGTGVGPERGRCFPHRRHPLCPGTGRAAAAPRTAPGRHREQRRGPAWVRAPPPPAPSRRVAGSGTPGPAAPAPGAAPRGPAVRGGTRARGRSRERGTKGGRDGRTDARTDGRRPPSVSLAHSSPREPRVYPHGGNPSHPGAPIGGPPCESRWACPP
ncbi:basic salivary proline-rich protein 1-like [Catharus ustulatus]|uniref:basic salivary proline-rich protein 1-like n=1 Tax=Catharus ustulatus TaxID=91951 RepID=UPI00140E584F|nr:basic salivary proline-rich protein 1-like [Catharus ustulatus]